MIFYGFYAFVAFSGLVALADWRKGVLMCLLIDAVRDPARKMVPGTPVLMTVAVAGVWLIVFAGLWSSEGRQLSRLFRLYPRLHAVPALLGLALVPAALVSCISYSGGWQMAAIGMLSYTFPFLGVAIGFAYPRTERDIDGFLKVYCVLAALLLIGTLAEWAGMSHSALGGIDKQWVRHHGGQSMSLISGYYRSPDVNGLHAALLGIFAVILALRYRGTDRWFWISLASYAALALLLSGRRKMIGMPVVFAATYLLLAYWRGSRRATRSLLAVGMIGAIGVCVVLLQAGVGEDYYDYAWSTVDEGSARLQGSAIGASLGTIRSAGIFGRGLGTATQGAQHLAVGGISFGGRQEGAIYSWNEDGVSRFFAEFGIPGTLLIGAVLVALLYSCRTVLRSIPPDHSHYTLAAGLLAATAANAASFAISHQAYSGDPSTIMIVAVGLGFVLAIPRLPGNAAPHRAAQRGGNGRRGGRSHTETSLALMARQVVTDSSVTSSNGFKRR